MPVEIPSSIKIKGKKIEILWSDNLDPEGSKSFTYGEWRPNENQIILRKGMSEVEQIKTLIHELCHVFVDWEKLGWNHTTIDKFEHVAYSMMKALGLIKPKRKRK